MLTRNIRTCIKHANQQRSLLTSSYKQQIQCHTMQHNNIINPIRTQSLLKQYFTSQIRSFHSNKTIKQPNTYSNESLESSRLTDTLQISHSISIRAYYAPSFDRAALDRTFPDQIRFIRPDCSIIPLSESGSKSISYEKDAYCALFGFGSADAGAVVFFNCGEAEQDRIFSLISHEPGSRIRNDSQDDYTVLVAKSDTTTEDDFECRFDIDEVVVSHLDALAVRVISQILGQTVGVAHYERVTAKLLEEFFAISQAQSRTGSLSALSSPADIVRIIGTTNSILTVMLTHIRVLDASEIVWKHGEFAKLWEGLRAEFDLENRYEVIETKLRTLHDNQNLFLELLHAAKSTRMEIIIIVLIAIEVMLSILFHSELIPWLTEKASGSDNNKKSPQSDRH